MPQTIPLPLAASSDHGSLAGLADDDHGQYALLGGDGTRNLFDGAGLVFDGTVVQWTNGAVLRDVVFDNDMVMGDNSVFYPGVSGQGAIGSALNKWGAVYTVGLFVGDIVMQRETEEGPAALCLREFPDRIDVLDLITGRRGTIPIVWNP
jgi:hypothetical protein